VLSADVLVVGYPNVGKSSIINNLRSLSLRRSGPRVAPTPGYTRQISGFLVSTSPPLFLFDTPGVMIPSFSSAAATQETALKLALTRAFRDSIVPSDVIARYLLLVLNRRAGEAGQGGGYEGETLRGLQRTEDAEEMLAWVAGRIDTAGSEEQGRAGEKQEEAEPEGRRQQSVKERAVQFLLRKFRSGEMGAMMLDDVQAETSRLREAEKQRQEMLRLRQERRDYEETVRTGKKISIITLDDQQQQQTDGGKEKG
jgi:ribosome biogenesis GTPase A